MLSAFFQTTIEENKFTASLDHPMSPSASIGEPLTMAAEVVASTCSKMCLTFTHLYPPRLKNRPNGA